jgi:hypothetical protein
MAFSYLRGKGAKRKKETAEKTPSEHHAAMIWAQRLKRVFNIPQGFTDLTVTGANGCNVHVT